jgi:hypothetical protein
MARFDPDTYPDRLDFEANAHRIRQEEIAKAFNAAVDWLRSRQREIATRIGRFAATVASHSHRHSAH